MAFGIGRSKGNEVAVMEQFDNFSAVIIKSIEEREKKAEEREKRAEEREERMLKILEEASARMYSVDVVALPPSTNDNYTVEKVSGLESEKIGSEILATLFGNMPNAHPSRLRPFYTDLERECGIALSSSHRDRVKDLVNKGDGKYPYRKIDSILMELDADYVLDKAKNYVFKK